MNWKEDKFLFLLSFFLVFFTLVTLGVVWARPDDGQTFTLFGGATSSFVGALLGWLTRPDKKEP